MLRSYLRLFGISLWILATASCSRAERAAVQDSGEQVAEPAAESAAAKKKKRSVSLMTSRFAMVDRALKNGEYVKATDGLLKMQLGGKLRTREDGLRYNSRMIELQGMLADAAAEGDPKAQKAMRLLRRSRGVR